MMNALRSLSRSWVGLALLGLLIAGLLVFGVGQTGNIGANTVLTAGQSSVSPVEYRLAYDRQLNTLSQQFGTRLTREQARQFGLDNQVLSQLVTGLVLDEQSRVMNLSLSEDRIAGLIAEDTAFHGVNGRFDRQQFRFVLSQVGMTEDAYISSLQNAARRQQIVEAVSDGITAPKFFISEQRRHQGQSRDVELIEITESAVGEIADPTEVDLTRYFEANRDRYRAPEYRSVKIVELTAETLANADDIPVESVRAEYERRIDNFREPERRTVRQLVFSDIEAAETARQRILAGEALETTVTDAGRTLDDVTLGTFTKETIPDQTIAETAFALAGINEVSDVIEGAFGPVLIWVSAIEPETIRPFEETEEELRSALALAEANDIILSVSDGYEDARAGGATMDEAAQGQQLEVVTFDAVDATGRGKDGEIVSLPTSRDLLREIFTADIDVENPPLAASGDGFIWYEVTGIEDERAQTLDEVRETAVADWKANELTRLMDELATNVAQQLRDGTTANELAETNGYTVSTKFGLTRTTDDADFGRSGVAEIFAQGPDSIGFVPAATGESRYVYRLTGITDPLEADAGGTDQISQFVAQGMANDLLQQTINKLQDEFPVSVNERAISIALGQ
ncbi:MAG: peptidylprolyl isomerase [Pseudomonadota bacterium]